MGTSKKGKQFRKNKCYKCGFLKSEQTEDYKVKKSCVFERCPHHGSWEK